MGEKVAIITDIHGNSSALKAVLDDIKKDSDINHIYCLGDMVGIGHETNEVLDLLFSEKNISFVMGNHDQSILDITSGQKPHSKGIEEEHHQWIAKHLDKQYIEQLTNIPKQIKTVVSGKKVLFVHYHLNRNNRFLELDTDPTLSSLEEIYDNMDVDIVCFGHHHTIHHFKSKNRLYVNPSALGCGDKPLAPYGVLEIGDKGQISILFKEVPYDNSAFLKSIYETKFPAYEIVLRAFHGNQHLQMLN